MVRWGRAPSPSFNTAVCLFVIAAGEVIACRGTSFSALRNFLLLGGATLVSSAMLSVVYVWIPSIVAFSATLISPATEPDWSLRRHGYLQLHSGGT